MCLLAKNIVDNIDTTGYTRQQVQQGTRYYNTISKTASANSYQQIGLGVNYSQVKQVRDYFLDKTYRRESGRSAFYEASVAAVEEVEDLFQELQGQTFSGSIKNLWESVQELAKDPSNSVNQGVFIQRCNEFIFRLLSFVFERLFRERLVERIAVKEQNQNDRNGDARICKIACKSLS